MTIALVVTGGLAGAIIGSFLATILIRWPRGDSVVSGRSHCDVCHVALPVHALVPVLSFVAQRGRCRACAAPIDRTHIAVEMICAAIGAAALWVRPDVGGAVLAVGGWLLVTLALFDARHLWLPDALVLPLALVGLAGAGWAVGTPALDRVIGLAGGFASLALVAAAYRAARGRDGLGGGDAKLFGALGAWLGWQALPLTLLVAALLGLGWALLRKPRHPSGPVQLYPLGTLLAIAAPAAWWLTRHAASWS